MKLLTNIILSWSQVGGDTGGLGASHSASVHSLLFVFLSDKLLCFLHASLVDFFDCVVFRHICLRVICFVHD